MAIAHGCYPWRGSMAFALGFAGHPSMANAHSHRPWLLPLVIVHDIRLWHAFTHGYRHGHERPNYTGHSSSNEPSNASEPTRRKDLRSVATRTTVATQSTSAATARAC